MIEKMKFISITGPKEDFDRMIEDYLSHYEVHLENALSELKTVQNLRPFIEKNPYKDKLSQISNYVNQYLTSETSPKKYHGKQVTEAMDSHAAMEIVEKVYRSIASKEKQKVEIANELEEITSLRSQIEPFKEIDANLQQLNHFQFINVRFGKIVTEHYTKLEHYMLDDSNSIFYKCSSNQEYVWGIYFVPKMLCKKIDAMYASMHFERIILPDAYEGTPMEAYLQLGERKTALEARLEAIDEEIAQLVRNEGQSLLDATAKLESLSRKL